MNKRWGSLLILAGLALSPIALQSGLTSLKTYVSGNPYLQVTKKPRAVNDLEFSDSRGNSIRLSDMNSTGLNQF